MNKEKKPKQSSDYGWNHPIDSAWERANYDGIKGFPPEWVPKPIMKQFCEKRGALFFMVEQGMATYLEIKSRFDWATNDIDHAFGSFDVLVGSRRDYDQAVLSLADIFIVTSKGEEKGLKLFAGEKAVKSMKFSTGGAAKKGKEYEPKASIRKICAEIESEKFDDMLAILRNADRCLDLYESTNDPIGVLFTGIDDDMEVISYLPRGELPNNQKEITFKRLRDILTEIKR